MQITKFTSISDEMDLAVQSTKKFNVQCAQIIETINCEQCSFFFLFKVIAIDINEINLEFTRIRLEQIVNEIYHFTNALHIIKATYITISSPWSFFFLFLLLRICTLLPIQIICFLLKVKHQFGYLDIMCTKTIEL